MTMYRNNNIIKRIKNLLLLTVIIDNLHFRDIAAHHHINVGCSQSESETKSLCVLKNQIISDGDVETLSVSGGVRGEGHKRIVRSDEFSVIVRILNGEGDAIN